MSKPLTSRLEGSREARPIPDDELHRGKLDLTAWFTGMPEWAFGPPHTPPGEVPALEPMREKVRLTKEALEKLPRCRGSDRPGFMTIARTLEQRLHDALQEGLEWRAASELHLGRSVLDPGAELVYNALLQAGAKPPPRLCVCRHCNRVWKAQRKPRAAAPLCASCDPRRPGSTTRKPHHQRAWENPLTGGRRYWGWCQKCDGPFFASDARTTHCRNCVGAGGQRLRRGGSERGRQRFVYDVVRPDALPDYLQHYLQDDHCVTDDAEVAQFFDYLVELGFFRKV